MIQIAEAVDVTSKIEDKIMQIENRYCRFFTDKEKDIAYEMFISGFLFGTQWSDQTSFTTGGEHYDTYN